MKQELLAPAGDIACAKAALAAGADAIYLGLPAFSARAGAGNFALSEFSETVRLAHLLGTKVYVCLNTLVKDGETDAFFESALTAWNLGADALLIQDIFLGKELKRRYPSMVLHLSTQAGCCNVYGAELAKEYGFSRVVLARETPLGDIAAISAVIETEAFVQGALCSCFSGQCYFSSFAGNNSGNRGRCKQPCRKLYSIDRAGFEERAYALSLSDLSVGERVRELLQAGVTSLKIEGRMRREEYVSAAVGYYRALLDGAEKSELLAARSALARTFDRGDYTEGLAFGQENLLSRNVQGHIGERVGVLEVKGGRYYCRGSARKGDGFKILRGGKEAGGAVCVAADERGFYLSSESRLRAGDEVRITTDTALKEALLKKERRREVKLFLRFVAGEPPKMRCGAFEMTGEPLARAERAPLSEEELKACFQKTDTLPFSVTFEKVETEGAFLPKSALNALRRTFFQGLADFLAPAREELAPVGGTAGLSPAPSQKTAVIAERLEGLKADVLIYKPRDYAAIDPAEVRKGEGEKYLYLPPFFTAEDERALLPALAFFDGVYAEGSWGVKFAEKYQKKLFAGTGFNLTNRFAVMGAKGAGAEHFALSKELSAREQGALAAEGAFVLTLGSVKVMDLCYCPFGRTCKTCDQRGEYRLTDEAGRSFPLRRYRTGGKYCRFEVYNCVPLAGCDVGAGALADASCRTDGEYLVSRAHMPEGALDGATKGHTERSML